MKKIFTFLLMLILALSSYAQTNVTKFLGIPVDGSREKMEKQIEKKGFKKVEIDGENLFIGEFNGQEVILAIKTNKNKVCRIVVLNYNNIIDESQIINRFNQLYNQFLNNSKYELAGGEMIDKDENISYQMKVKNKVYEAVFYQAGTQEEINEMLLSKYTEEQLENPSKKLEKEISNYINEKVNNKMVWFKAFEDGAGYRIAIFYDNKYNFPNGEDL